ncbi:MAG: exo-alpha-sialidase [Clostridia bacterium]|nr:exo-alpha-sialidase [Clostridia bacterium]
MKEEFKEIIKSFFRSMYFYTFVFAIVFIISKVIINSLNLEYMQYIYKGATIAVVIGILLGIIQSIIKSETNGRRTLIIVTTLLIVIIVAPIVAFFIAFQPPEHIVEKGNKKYVAYVYSWHHTRVDYYEYMNFFVRGITKRIEENYKNGGDVLDKEHKGLYMPNSTYYYNVEGKITNNNFYTAKNSTNIENNNEEKDNKNIEQQKNQQENMESIIPTGDDSILYQKDNIIIRVGYLGNILNQRSVVTIYKSTDGGKTFTNMKEAGITINEGAELTFIDENTGFINDPGIVGTAGDNRRFLVSSDGGATFKKANIIHPDSIEEKNLLVNGVPYIVDGKLKLEVYTLNHSKNPKRTYYIFTSTDNGLSWSLEKKKQQ